MSQPFGDLDRRSAMIQARVTPEERALVERQAHARGQTVSEFTREALGAAIDAANKKQEAQV